MTGKTIAANNSSAYMWKHRLVGIVPGIVIGIFYAIAVYIVSVKLAYAISSDMHAHAYYVVQYWENESFSYLFSHIPYPGWHVVVEFFLLFGIGLSESAGLASAVFGFLTALIVYYVVEYIVGFEKKWLSAVSTIALLFVSAIYMPWYNESVYVGQGSPTIWHNPTYNAAKPFALLSCFILFKIVEGRQASFKRCMLYAVLTLVCLFMKPSFFQVQAPAVFLYLIIDFIINRDWKYVRNIVLSFVPAFVYMLIEFWIVFYSSSGGGSGITLSLFTVQRFYSPNLIISTVLFLAFLIYVAVVLRKDIFTFKSPYIYFFLLVLAGFCEYGFIMESGDRALHGNFAWGYYLAIFICWVFALALFVKRSFVDKTISKPLIVIGCILVLLHFLSGVCYYMLFMLDTTGLMVF